MKKILFLLLFIYTVLFLSAQVKDIKGRLMIGSAPLSKTAFVVKNRNIQGKTDGDGYFILRKVTDEDIIQAANREYPIQDVIIEVLSENELPVVSPLLNSANDTLGVFFFTGKVPLSSYPLNLYSFDKIKSIKYGNNNQVQIDLARSYDVPSGYKVSYISFVDFATVGRLPKLQSEYAQGRNNNWYGAADSEIFSWGPKIQNLEYSGTPYLYDKNGSLVAAGTGNGIPANSYSTYDFFRTGISFGNTVDIKFPGFLRGISSVSVGQKRNNGIIPNNYTELYNVSFLMDKIKFRNFSSDFGVLYKNSYGKLTGKGSNMSSLLYAVLTTPPTFDNSNGLSSRDAVSSNDSWQLNDGTQRSYAKNRVNNPYMLINTLPDRNTSDNLLAYLKTNYSYRKFHADVSVSYNKDWNKSYNGILSTPFNHYTYRNEEISNTIASVDVGYKLRNHSPEIELVAGYGFRRNQHKLHRYDELLFQGNMLDTVQDRTLSRNTHDVKYGLKLSGRDIMFYLYNKHYFSNTLSSSRYLNLFPETGFRWDMRDFLDNIVDYLFYGNFYGELTLYASLGSSMAESHLVYQDKSSLSTVFNSADFGTYYEYRDIFFNHNLKPEIYLKSEIGLKYSNGFYYRNSFSAEINFFNYNTRNFTAPVWEGNGLQPLHNIGTLRNYGYFISLEYNYRIQSNIHGGVVFNFSQIRNKVMKINGEYPFIRLGGFTDIATVFAENQSLGSIYGTTYQRSGQGQLIIGDDGFPLADHSIKKIGDPTPDFVMSMIPSFKWKKWNISLTMEYSHGGDRWNGTRAVLDYHGVSEGSASERIIKDHLFDGVNSAGNKNSVTVDYYDPNLPVNENKWVRYGMTGVGEEYIEKATYFRLSDISLGYTFFKDQHKFFRTLILGARIQNVFLVTAYKGSDPASLLFGYSSGSGLDLFNQPSTRNYSLSITLEL